MYEPMVARESTAMMTPPWKMKPSVVVPWQGLTSSTTSRSKESTCVGLVGVPREERGARARERERVCA